MWRIKKGKIRFKAGGAILDKVIRKDLFEEVTCKHRTD